MDEEYPNKILNIALPINDVCTLIGSDANPAYGQVVFGENCYVVAEGDEGVGKADE